MGEGSRGMQGDRRDNGDYFRLVGWRRWWGRGRGECRETSETMGTTFGWLGVASICPHCLACLGRFSLVGPARRHLSPLSRLSRWVLWRAQLGDPCPVPMSQEFLWIKKCCA